MFIVDFDDTLFDAEGFKKLRLKEFIKFGVSEKLYWETYQTARINDQGQSSYSNTLHAEVLSTKGFSYDKILSALNATTTPEQVSKFVFPDAAEFLMRLRSLGGPVILLSLGEPNMQELKVKGSGLHNFFDRVFIVEDTKTEILDHLFTQEPAAGSWLVNDKIIESEELRSRFKQMRVVLKRSARFPIQDYERCNFSHFGTLTEIYDYIIKQK